MVRFITSHQDYFMLKKWWGFFTNSKIGQVKVKEHLVSEREMPKALKKLPNFMLEEWEQPEYTLYILKHRLWSMMVLWSYIKLCTWKMATECKSVLVTVRKTISVLQMNALPKPFIATTTLLYLKFQWSKKFEHYLEFEFMYLKGTMHINEHKLM